MSDFEKIVKQNKKKMHKELVEENPPSKYTTWAGIAPSHEKNKPKKKMNLNIARFVMPTS